MQVFKPAQQPLLKGSVMKGMVQRDGGGTGSFVIGAVNDTDWARQYVLDGACQNEVDTKAFTGRGKFHELRVLLTDVETLEQSMRELVDVTKRVPGYLMHLAMHVHNSNGSTSLRWRDRESRRHLSWEEAAAKMQNMPSEVFEWYAKVTQQCQALNERHKELRRGIAVVRRSINAAPQRLYPRAVLAQ